MSMSSYPGGFRGGVLLKEVPMFDTITGSVFWVDSVNGGDGNPGTFNRPLATIDAAIGKCTASKGDEIHCKPGHSESIAGVGSIAFDVAGVKLVGHGYGANQAQVKWITNATASILVTAADVAFVNMRFTAAVADVTEGINLSAAADGFRSYNCLYDESGTDLNWVIVYGVADLADDLEFVGNVYIAGDIANDSFFVGAGTVTKSLFQDNHFEHNAVQTSVIAILRSATAMKACRMLNNVFVTQEPVLAASCVVFSGTTNTGFAHNNFVCGLDSDATAANSTSAFDVTGMALGLNYSQDTVDVNAAAYAVSDLT